MSEMERLSLLSKEIAHEAGVELDFEELDQLRVVVDRVGPKWPAEAMAILKDKNQPLLDRLSSLESQLDSLILMVPKPAMLKKDFKTKLEDYEKTIEMCIDYASRHIQK
jgi:hypothetical protein